MNKFKLIMVAFALLVSGIRPVFAGDLKLSLSKLPEYKNTSNFKLYYTYFETEDKSATVNLYIQKDGKDWRQTNDKNKTDVSGYFEVSGSDFYDNAGKYNFYAQAKTGEQTITSATVSTTLDDYAPSAPTEYAKERLNATTYKLSWKNPYDEDYSKVYIYRSKDVSFTADTSTRIGEAGGSKEEKMIFSDGSVQADVTYYYALRALDRAGNASGVVTDAPGTVTAGQVAGVATTTGTGVAKTGEETVKVLPATEEVTPAEATTEDQLGGGTASESNGEVQGASTSPSRSWAVVGIIVIILVAASIYFFFKNRRLF